MRGWEVTNTEELRSLLPSFIPIWRIQESSSSKVPTRPVSVRQVTSARGTYLVSRDKGLVVGGHTMSRCNHVVCRNQGSSTILRLTRFTQDSNLPWPRSWVWNLSTYYLTDGRSRGCWACDSFYATWDGRRSCGWRGGRRNVLSQCCVGKQYETLVN